MALAAAMLAIAFPTSATADKVTICHATGSESNPFVVVEASAAGVYNGHLGEDHQNGEDIIPPFTYNEQEYSQNWDEEGQAIFENECEVPCPGADQAIAASHCETTTSTSETKTETEQVPFFGGAGPSTVALGTLGALGGAFLMLRRRL